MKNKIKEGSTWYGIQPEMVMIDTIVQTTFNHAGHACVRTAGSDKKHGTHSLHPPGFAIDYRSKHISDPMRSTSLNRLLIDLKKALPQCDVVLEHVGLPNEHYHIEYDPKDDATFQSAKTIYRDTGMWPARW